MHLIIIEWRAQEIRRRLRSGKNDMTINPIYDGTEGEHYYDHIPAGVAQQPQYVSLVNNQLITEEVLSKIQNGDESVQESAAAGNEYQVYHMTSKPQVTKSKSECTQYLHGLKQLYIVTYPGVSVQSGRAVQHHSTLV